jgi:formiminotetrahydrofolate cyclodeaminase
MTEEATKLPRPEELLNLSVRAFTAATAAKLPIPGGGSVAGVVGALATALGEMALAFTRGKKKFAHVEAEHAVLADRLARAQGMFADLTSDDAAAYGLYQEAKGLPDGPDKQAQSQAALAAAINVPREMTALALSVIQDLRKLGDNCNAYLLTDLGAGAILAEAVVRLCDYNVRVNAAMLPDKAAAQELRQASARDCARAAELCRQIDQVVSRQV